MASTHRRLVRLRRSAVLLATGVGFVGCATDTPYSSDAGAIDRTSPTTGARIRLSPPQVYPRAQLINDRLTERRFLADQLQASASASIGNALVRDLRAVSALSAQLSASFDPAAKLNFERQNQQADLQQQINLTQLKTQLVTLQAQLTAATAAAAQVASAPASAASAGTAASSPTVSSAASAAAAETVVKTLQSRLDTALTAVATMEAAQQRQNAADVPFIDEFDDRLAVRSRIRDAFNANQLDDVHDLNGNALYKLQFMATVLPGANPKQLGVVSVQVEKPTLGDAEYAVLYSTWLASVTSRMNPDPGNDGVALQVPMRLQSLGPLTGLYEVARLPLTRLRCEQGDAIMTCKPMNDQEATAYYDPKSGLAASRKPPTLPLAVYPGHRTAIEFTNDGRPGLAAVAKAVSSLKSGEASRCIDSIFDFDAGHDKAFHSACGLDAEDQNRLPDLLTLIKLTDAVIGIAPSVDVAVNALGDRSDVSKTVKWAAGKELQTYLDALANVKTIYNRVATAKAEYCKKARDAVAKSAEAAASAVASAGSAAAVNSSAATDQPERAKRDVQACERFNRIQLKVADTALASFKAAMTAIENQGASDERRPVAAYAYSTDPITRTQRVSTVASAANALELAAGLALQAPGSGAAASAGLDYVRRAAGRVDTIERVPEVIGFSGVGIGAEPKNRKDGSREGIPFEFGWLFGPKLGVDPQGKKVLLRQEARTVPVSVDLSVPGWWPHAKLKVRTAWRGNFEGAAALGADIAESYVIPVKFRRDQASMDALTVELARAVSRQGFHQASIAGVRPDVIAVCGAGAGSNAKVTLLIDGVDLWRNPSVYLGGMPLADVAVLPDMAGLSATVDTASLLRAGLAADATLVVRTTHGKAERKMRVKVSDTCETAEGRPTAVTDMSDSAALLRVAPSRVSACDAGLAFIVSGRELKNDRQRFRFGGQLATKVDLLEGQSYRSRKSAQVPGSDEVDIETYLVTFDDVRGRNAGLDQVPLSFAGGDGVVSVPITVVGDPKSCEPAKPAAPKFAFATDIDRLFEAPDTTRWLRVRLGLPAGRKPSVTLTAKGAEIVEAKALAGVAQPIGMNLAGGALKLASTADLAKPSEPATIDLKLRGLNRNAAVVLSATSGGDDPTTLTRGIAVDAGDAAGATAATAKAVR